MTTSELQRERPSFLRTLSRSAFVPALLLAGFFSGPAAAEKALVGVAANFSEVAERLARDFEQASGHTITFVAASTGKLYAQIANGSPLDAFLSADQESPARLVKDGVAVKGSRFTYATGRLTLWSRDPGRIGRDGAALLRQGKFRRLAIANPALAPYGVAAKQTLEKLGLWKRFADRIVMGETIGQAHVHVASGNAELGFVALSSVLSPRNATKGSRWDVPVDLYAPIRQDAVLLVRGAGNPAARGFLDFLRSRKAKTVIEAFGYGVAHTGSSASGSATSVPRDSRRFHSAKIAG